MICKKAEKMLNFLRFILTLRTKLNSYCILIIRINYSVRYFLQNNNSK